MTSDCEVYLLQVFDFRMEERRSIRVSRQGAKRLCNL